jgi:hypothetical protein
MAANVVSPSEWRVRINGSTLYTPVSAEWSEIGTLQLRTSVIAGVVSSAEIYYSGDDPMLTNESGVRQAEIPYRSIDWPL